MCGSPRSPLCAYKYLTRKLLIRAVIPASPVGPVSRSEFEREALRWSRDVHRFALSMTRDETEAEDVVQDTYLRAFRSWKTFEPGTDCRRWLFTICRNVFLRSRERSRRLVPVDTVELDAALNEGSKIAGGADQAAEDFATVDISSAILRAV